MARQKRRIEVATGNPGVSNNFIDIAFDNSTEVNVHGFRCEIAIEPEDAGANANGMIAIWVLPGGVIQNTDLPLSYGAMGDEDFAPYLWGMSPWIASNETPTNFKFEPKTSRNVQRGGRIVVHLLIAGVSGGLVRHNTMITCFTT